MSATEWAEREVRYALEKMVSDADESQEPLKSAYEAALNAFKALFDGPGEGLSGAGYSIARATLKTLLDEQPLSPIYDTPDVWSPVSDDKLVAEFQCIRKPSLFKTVNKETGDVEFSDVDRIQCVDENGFVFHNGFINRKITEMFPVTMPYMPKGKYKVSASSFSTTGEPGVFDTIIVKWVEPPGEKRVQLNWYFKECEDETGFVQISKDEYLDRYQQYVHNNIRLRMGGKEGF